MRINAVSANCNGNYNSNNTNFNGLIKDKSALPIIRSMSEKDKLEFNKIRKRLSRTKFWDMKISSVGNNFKEFKFKFISKKSGHGVITDGIYPYNQNGKTIDFYTIIYGPENMSLSNVEKLYFKSEERAKKLYDKYQQTALYARNRGYYLAPIESLRIKEFELMMLEESARVTHGKRNISQLNTAMLIKPTTGNNLSYK